MEEALVALLAGAPSVRALCDRINWGEHPQRQDAPGSDPADEWPGIVLHLVSDVGGHVLQGPSGPRRARVQVDCYAVTYGEAVHLARAVHAVLDGHRAGILMGVFHAGTRSGREGDDVAGQPFRRSLDFTIHYRRLA